MRALAIIAAAVSLAVPAAAGARIETVGSGYSYGAFTLGAHQGGITVVFHNPYPWARDTVAYNTANGNVLVGCRGAGVATVRVWTHGHGWKLTTCSGTESWRVVLRRVPANVPIEARVTFQMLERSL